MFDHFLVVIVFLAIYPREMGLLLRCSASLIGIFHPRLPNSYKSPNRAVPRKKVYTHYVTPVSGERLVGYIVSRHRKKKKTKET
jgi:hypothetical protein